MPIVVRNPVRTDPMVAAAFTRFGVATVHEAQDRTGLLDPRLRPIHPGSRIAGTAVTVSVPPGDNWMIHVAVEQCRRGDVLVVAPTSHSQAGYIGELIATALRAHGALGVVIDAGCRDVAELARMGFPVWSACVSAYGTVKQTLGDVNVPVVCAGQRSPPGDVVVADDDGVVGGAAGRRGRGAGGLPAAGGEGGAVPQAVRGRRAEPGRLGHAGPAGGVGTRLRRRRGRLMIIDAHGHYTTVPAGHRDFRTRQLAWLSDPSGPRPDEGAIGDDEIRESIENNQLKHLRERGEDLMLISPQASAMEHHVPDPAIAVDWARSCNDLVHRVTGLFPAHFAAVCQLPQTPGGDLAEPIAELRRCVSDGFVGCNVSPDPSGGHWTSPPMTDPYWFPLYDALVELDVPAMVHVSSSCNPNFHALGAHYLNADTSVFMQLVEGDLFGRFPTLRLVIPHGGGAVPYHWGRYRGLADRLGQPEPRDHVLPERLLRHLRLPPGRDRPAARGDPGRQHPVRLRDDRRGPRHHPGPASTGTTPSGTSTPPGCPRRTGRRSSRPTRCARTRGWPPGWPDPHLAAGSRMTTSEWMDEKLAARWTAADSLEGAARRAPADQRDGRRRRPARHRAGRGRRQRSGGLPVDHARHVPGGAGHVDGRVAGDGGHPGPALASYRDRVEFRLVDIEDLSPLPAQADVITTSRASHHLDAATLARFYASAAAHLAPGGWLVNLDHVLSPGAWDRRAAGRARGDDPAEEAGHRASPQAAAHGRGAPGRAGRRRVRRRRHALAILLHGPVHGPEGRLTCAVTPWRCRRHGPGAWRCG